jgi:hypothetical protein
MDKDAILETEYFNPERPAAYAGPQKVFSVLRRKYPGLFTLEYISKWLSKQDAYAVQKPIRHRFKTANVRVTSINEQWDVDLLSMINLSNDNDGVRYLLCAIDIFSRKLMVQPLKNKTAKSVLEGMKKILKYEQPKKIRADKGSEFVNQWFKKLMEKENIYFFTTQNPPKANFVERVQRTLKTSVYRFMRHKRNYRYIDNLDKIVSSYNNSPHRGLKGLSPNQINKNNEADVWASIYLTKHPLVKRKPIYKFKVGDLVRISFNKAPFRRAYQEQFTTEVFKISNRMLKQGIVMYRLKDLKNEEVKGLFYNSELQKVDKDENSLWFIERIIRRRKKKTKMEYLVKWQGFPDAFNSWVDANDVKDTREVDA